MRGGGMPQLMFWQMTFIVELKHSIQLAYHHMHEPPGLKSGGFAVVDQYLAPALPGSRMILPWLLRKEWLGFMK